MNKQEIEKVRGWRSRMTIDEAILHCEEKSEQCNECGRDHAQLAEWLRELKQLREQQLTGGWIPVSETPPAMEDGGWAAFIIPNYFSESTYKIVARYFVEHGINHEDEWTDKRVVTATHWMPLFEPLEGR